MAVPYKYQAKEVLNKVLNSGEDALKVDIDNVTLDGSQLSVDIDKEKDLKEKYNIKVLPTIIVFNNAKEVCRFKGNLLFQLTTKKKEVQTKIDSIIINKFN